MLLFWIINFKMVWAFCMLIFGFNMTFFKCGCNSSKALALKIEGAGSNPVASNCYISYINCCFVLYILITIYRVPKLHFNIKKKKEAILKLCIAKCRISNQGVAGSNPTSSRNYFSFVFSTSIASINNIFELLFIF